VVDFRNWNILYVQKKETRLSVGQSTRKEKLQPGQNDRNVAAQPRPRIIFLEDSQQFEVSEFLHSSKAFN
jgi:hypothetical protein